jgi:aminoacrylate hydrolase
MIDGIMVETYGPQGAPAVLFSSGLGGAGGYWRQQADALANDYRVVLYDHRGTGSSSRDVLPASYSVDHMADDMLLILEGLSIDAAHIVGHAAGGVAGLALALRAPSRISGLTVVNAWAAADPHFVRCFEIRRAIYEAGGAEAYLKAQPLFLYPAEWISDHLLELDTERAHQVADFQNRDTLFARIDALAAFDVRDRLASVRCPVLVIGAADDMLVPGHAAHALAEGLPNATFNMMPWGGHAVNVTAQADFDAILADFLYSQHPLV